MTTFLVDEDLPRSLAPALINDGFETIDVRDLGLRGAADDRVFERARSERRCLITGDGGFGNLLEFPIGTHSGILVANLPNELSARAVTDAIVAAIKELDPGDIDGNLVIVEPGRIRIRGTMP